MTPDKKDKNAPVKADSTNGMADSDLFAGIPGIDSLKGKHLDEFLITREIGRGSMGVVFEAVQESLNRRVAIKALPPSINLPEKSIRRFLREAESVARLQHENIVQIYAIGQKGSLYYYAMQYIEGRSLDEIVKAESPLPFDRIARLMLQAAVAMEFAHRHEIIHRDIKPGNILVTKEDKVVITDFGLARKERGATLTESGALVGTPLYMSPEQVQAKKGGVGRSTDIYSLGVTLYELLTGEPPFQGENTQEILNKILEEEPRPARKIRTDAPWELDVIAMKAMEKEERHRFATAGDMATDMKRYLDGEPILARPSGTITRLIKKVRKHRVISSMAAVASVLLLTIMAYSLSVTRQMKQTQTDVGIQKNVAAYETLLNEGRTFLRDGSTNKAMEKFQQAVVLIPGRADGHMLLGQALDRKGDEEAALAELDKAVAADPDNGNALFVRSEMLLRRNRLVEGLGDLMRAKALEPNDFSIAQACAETLYNYYLMGTELPYNERAKRLDTAMACGENALKLGNSADMRCLISKIYYEKAKLATPGSEERKGYFTRAQLEVDLAADLDRNHREAFELKKMYAQSDKTTGFPIIDIVAFFAEQGLDQGLKGWAISQTDTLRDEARDFLDKNFLPFINRGPSTGDSDSAAEKSPPR